MKQEFLQKRCRVPLYYILIPVLLAAGLFSCKKKYELNDVKHVVVIYLENHSFDNLYGQFEGANGLSNASKDKVTQLDSNGNAYANLPPINGYMSFPQNLPNQYFDIDQYVSPEIVTPDVMHAYYQEQLQIDGGKMDKYALYNSIYGNSGGLTMGYYKTKILPMYEFARKYTLCDNFFHSAFGGSFINHMWLIAAATPLFPNAPAIMRAQLEPSGKLIQDGQVSPDGYVVNTSFTKNTPHPFGIDSSTLVPDLTMPTIGDRLNEKNISWAWYSGGWDDAIAGNPPASFQFHHQPFAYFANYADGTPGRKEHLKDEKDFISAAKSGNLPAVSFVKPLGINNEHPGYSPLAEGEKHTVDLIKDVLNGPDGDDAVIIVTYDEHGGFWDHVPPPVIDRWGPGTRVPAIIISKFAKRGYVDHTQYETVSILSFIEKRWGLAPLSDRDKNANPFTGAFNFK
ncbi:MAG TPA: alkaline phosphatase family protein [Chitinophagaceae bacterium]|nr:alkaline phosphatase family protein [Chitinophagaceae bacterium]